MPVNHYFQSGLNQGRRSEQNLYEDLIVESLKIYGFEMYYMPRKAYNQDIIFTEDALNSFEHAYPLEMYLENVNGFAGEGDLLSRFGIEIQDSATFVVARKRWIETVGRSGNAVLENRPADGDLLYFPLTDSLFEIRKVEAMSPFYQVGKLYVFRLECELFQYSSERIDTGVESIDDIEDAYTLDVLDYQLLQENGEALLLEYNSEAPLILEEHVYVENDVLAQNPEFDVDIEDILDFSERNPFGEIYK
jgi:hypothetical protein